MSAKRIWLSISTLLVLLLAYSLSFSLPLTTLFIRFFALAAFFLLCVSLLIGPSVILFGPRFAPWVKHRRRVGLLAFFCIAIHFTLVMTFVMSFSFEFILSMWQFFIAFIALMILLLLALTSSNTAMRILGSRWKLLQRFVYVAFILVFIHFVLDANGLFVRLGNGTTVINIAEVVLVLLGIVTIGMQVLGFLKKVHARQSPKSPPEKTE